METKNTYAIDAAGRTLGRVASEAAKALMGKMRADYTPNKPSKVKVTITNAAELDITEKKRMQRVYKRYSGYPGGQKEETYGMLVARRGEGEALRRAILGMLPKNKLQVKRIKLLTIEK